MVPVFEVAGLFIFVLVFGIGVFPSPVPLKRRHL
jgi:hypothetical protein